MSCSYEIFAGIVLLVVTVVALMVIMAIAAIIELPNRMKEIADAIRSTNKGKEKRG